MTNTPKYLLLARNAVIILRGDTRLQAVEAEIVKHQQYSDIHIHNGHILQDRAPATHTMCVAPRWHKPGGVI